jgi:hypothetical protein
VSCSMLDSRRGLRRNQNTSRQSKETAETQTSAGYDSGSRALKGAKKYRSAVEEESARRTWHGVGVQSPFGRASSDRRSGGPPASCRPGAWTQRCPRWGRCPAGGQTKEDKLIGRENKKQDDETGKGQDGEGFQQCDSRWSNHS